MITLVSLGTTIPTLVLRLGHQFFKFRDLLLVVSTCFQRTQVHLVVLTLAAWGISHDFAPFADSMFRARMANGSEPGGTSQASQLPPDPADSNKHRLMRCR